MNNYLVCFVLFLSNFLEHLGHVTGSQVLHIRGIPVSKNSLYAPDRDFQCLDGSLLVPFSYVNDDYCDCYDGSDEPGTAACGRGTLYCKNIGHKSAYIPSSWVNDGVCDCCDGSDEYSSGKQCVNNCHDLGREAWFEAKKIEELRKEGNKIRLDMVAKGKQIKSDIQARLVKLWADYDEILRVKKEKEVTKNLAEERERTAKEKFAPPEPEQTATDEEAEEEEEPNSVEAEEYFKMLDSDDSGTITIGELQTRVTFDKNKDGAVSEEEALFFLGNERELAFDEFVKSAWLNIKPFLMLEQGMFKPADQKWETETGESEDNRDKEEEEGREEEAGVGDQDKEAEEHEPEEQEPEVQYDEETQALIDEATSARERFQEVEKAANELQAEIKRLEEKMDRDYGYEHEFASMDGECFEYSDLEYVYSLCLFGKASQRSKSGGSDVSLGHWYSWVGPEGNKYSKMKYDKGLTCWNGPARSTIVSLSCGKENKLISVTEPSRCEYAMEFSTPALCNLNAESHDSHDEL